MKRFSAIVLSAVFAFGASVSVSAQTAPPNADQNLWQKALKLHRKAIVIDGHNDITSPMFDENFELSSSSLGKYHRDGDPFHTDLARFRQSGMTGEFFSIYVDKKYAVQGGSARRAMDLIDATYREVEKNPSVLTPCTTADEIRRAKKAGKICALMGIEGGHAIEDSLSVLRDFYRLGVRYMTLTHNNSNNWADSSRDKALHNGLTDFGKEVVREMNRIGMLVDVSHVSDKTMSDVLDISTAPIIASHSSAFAISAHPRNISDELLKRIAKNGGVVMVNFYPAFIDERHRREDTERSERLKPQLDALREKYKDDSNGYNEAERALLAQNPIYTPDYTRIADHIDHIVKVAGIDHVGIGSDFDGIPNLPNNLSGIEDLPVITYELLKRGYSENDVRKILGENFLRAFSAAERAARRPISAGGSLKRIK